MWRTAARRVASAASATCSRTPRVVASAPLRRLFAVRATSPLFDKLIVKVPTMGDAITEGTIVEWAAQVGQAVKEGDVVALVETDKVTVDIKADVDGVVVNHFGAVDDTVEVGADLYEIDTEGVATVVAEDAGAAAQAAEPAPPAQPAAVPAPATPAPIEAPPSNDVRVPAIRFLGKAGWAARRSGKPAFPPPPEAAATGSITGTTVVVDGSDLGPMYGRLPFTEEEMDALLLGGAEHAPKVKVGSGGAVFGI